MLSLTILANSGDKKMKEAFELQIIECGCKFVIDADVYNMLGTATSFYSLKDYLRDNNIFKDGKCMLCQNN